MLIKTRPGQKKILHVGCGPKSTIALPPILRTEDWQEVRLDLDPKVEPDIVASITKMTPVANDSMDGVFSSHNLEHVYFHEVPLALSEFYRVLRVGGFTLIFVPNLQAVAEQVAQGNVENTLYVSSAGPISAIDMLYGFRPSLQRGNHFMGHKMGFTSDSLTSKLKDAGFKEIEILVDAYSLIALGYK